MGVPALLEVQGVSKRFGSVLALRDAGLECMPGEVRALVGANGSGKSTLVKVLSGFHEPEPGARVTLEGQAIEFPMHPNDFVRYGIASVHQDLCLLEGVSVLENCCLYSMAASRTPTVSWRSLKDQAERSLQQVDLHCDLSAPIEVLSRADRALVALARALSGLELSGNGQSRRGVLILDEITVFLARHEVRVLQNAIHRVRDSGHVVLFVSHDLDEVMAVADTVTVLRDGSTVFSARTSETSVDELVQKMVGRRPRSLDRAPDRGAIATGTQTRDTSQSVSVEGLEGAGVSQVTFDVAAGEVLGLTGLAGSGYESVPYLLFGALKATAGNVVMQGECLSVVEVIPREALRRGIGLVPGSRHRQGLLMSSGIAENAASVVLEEMRGRSGLLSWAKIRSRGRAAIDEYEILAPGPEAVPAHLSGGNQQRVMLAKWLMRRDRLLLLHEPVQGVDVAARAALIQLLRQRAGQGVPVVCATSDYSLLVELCDRVLVFAHGRVRHEVLPEKATGKLNKETIIELCISGDPADSLKCGLEDE